MELRRDLIFSLWIFCMPDINVTITFDFGIGLWFDKFVFIDDFLFSFEIGLEMGDFELELIDEVSFGHV